MGHMYYDGQYTISKLITVQDYNTIRSLTISSNIKMYYNAFYCVPILRVLAGNVYWLGCNIYARGSV